MAWLAREVLAVLQSVPPGSLAGHPTVAEVHVRGIAHPSGLKKHANQLLLLL
jgi:hypothetical protein